MVIKILKKIVYYLDCFFPKNEKKIYLKSDFLYRDNIQAVFEEIIRSGLNEKYKIYCDGIGFINYPYYNVFYLKRHTINSLLLFLRSKHVFCDIGLYGLRTPAKGQTLINTWHGTSLKKIGYYLEETRNPVPKATYVVGYSPFFTEVLSHAFGVPANRVLLTGEPRNDYFFDADCQDILDKLGLTGLDNQKLLIWMPTYRQNTVTKAVEGADYDFGIPLLTKENVSKLNEICHNNNITLLIKWHGLQITDSIKNQNFSNLKFITSEDIQATGMPLYHLVACCDGLITDYSSIYVNYLVLNRPICFAYDDMDKYIANRGFMFDNVKSIMPGVHANTFDELVSFIEDFSQGKDEYKAERKRVNVILNSYSDNRNSYRLLKAVGLIE